ncbi:MAG: AAA family ATPase [Chloroflexota bacterium]
MMIDSLRDLEAINAIKHNRYILHDKIGKGGMGVVYRATDRLSGEMVALKQVTLFRDQQEQSENSSISFKDMRLALTHEFHTLATLRHPHIISVLDYGFDAETQPFFTMNYLPEAETILEAGRGKSIDEIVKLIRDLLQALAYVHRRGVLHRDIKPDNVLVSGGDLRVLDFGLSIDDSRNGLSQAGTPLYMAPELIEAPYYSKQTDLYAVGVLFYQLLTEKHPFEPFDHTFLDRLLDTEPDFTLVDERLRPIFSQLLAKQPEGRFKTAERALVALASAMGQPKPEETQAIRDSYLQASKFVGREQEMARLTTALAAAKNGEASFWLIGGESGVGKTRLLDEFKTEAVVSGWQIISGQAISERSIPYQIWQRVIPQLIIYTEVSDLEAGILKQIVPELGQLLNRHIPDPPHLGAEAAQQRLIATIVDLFKRLARPTLLVLEDIQWLDESLIPLERLLNILEELSNLMVVGAYRTEEDLTLSQRLAKAQKIILKRLDSNQVRELSEMMLGHEPPPALLALIQQQTEGNTFFIVEVMRSLAEQAGGLNTVGEHEIPDSVWTRDMGDWLQRRIRQVSEPDRHLLELAALIGRELNLNLLSRLTVELSIDLEIDSWLERVSNAAVLTVRENKWLFAHDKLRETILAGKDNQHLSSLHQKIAEAIEAAYPDQIEMASALANHWGKAGQVVKEQAYLQQAIQEAMQKYAHGEAIKLLSRALELVPENAVAEKFDLLKLREEALAFIGDQPARLSDLEALSSLVQSFDVDEQAYVAFREGIYAFDVSQFIEAKGHGERSLQILGGQAGQKQRFNAYWLIGRTCVRLGEYDEALEFLDKARQIAVERGSQADLNLVLPSLPGIYFIKNGGEKAIEMYEQTISISQQTGERSLSTMISYFNMGCVLALSGYIDRAQVNYDQGLNIARENGDKQMQSYFYHNMASAALVANKHDETEAYLQNGLSISREIGSRLIESHCLIYQGRLNWKRMHLEEARQNLIEGRQIAEELNLPHSSIVADANMIPILITKEDRPAVERLVDIFLAYIEDDPTCEKAHERYLVFYHFAIALKWLNHPRQNEIIQHAYTVLHNTLINTVSNPKTLEAIANVEEYAGIQRLYETLG